MTDTDIKELTTFANEWDRAMLSNNAEEIAPFLSDDWIIVGSDGITTRQEFLHWISSGAVTHNRMDSDELVIRVYDNTSLIVSRGTSAGSWQGQDFSLYEWSTSTCLRKEGRWFCVLTMLTNASSPQQELLIALQHFNISLGALQEAYPLQAPGITIQLLFMFPLILTAG